MFLRCLRDLIGTSGQISHIGAATKQENIGTHGGRDVADLTGCSDKVRRRGSDGEWTRVSTLPAGPLALTAIATTHGMIYLFGGCSMPQNGNVMNHAEAYRYDPRAGSWTKLRPLPAASRGASAVAVDERHIYLLGGYGDTFRADALIYDVQTDTYAHAEPLPALPLMAASFVLSGRTIYGAGGEDRPRGRSARMIVGDLTR